MAQLGYSVLGAVLAYVIIELLDGPDPPDAATDDAGEERELGNRGLAGGAFGSNAGRCCGGCR